MDPTCSLKDDKEVDSSESLGEDISVKKDGGLRKVIVRQGSGDEFPFKGAELKVHYEGRLVNGKKFDSSRDRLQPFVFLLGKGSVIKGWEVGVKTMRKGEICKLICKPEYAYGADGSPPKIPPYATLIFEIELIDWSEMIVCNKGEVTKVVVVEGLEWQNPSNQDIIKAHIIGKYGSTTFMDMVLSFELGEASESGLCKGLGKGISKMVKGEMSRFRVKPGKFSYTPDQRARLNIPENTELLFYVDLKDFDRATPVWDLDSTGRLNYAKSMKERGNVFFKQGKFELALQKYEFLVQALDGIFKDEDKEAGAPLKLVGHLNCAACHLKHLAYGKCIDECTKALNIDPTNVKAFYRRGFAHLKLIDVASAKADLLQAVKLDPKNKAVRDLLKEATDLLKTKTAHERSTYANMFQKFAEQDMKREAKMEKEKNERGGQVFRDAVENAPEDSRMEDEETEQNSEQEDSNEKMQINGFDKTDSSSEEFMQQDPATG